VRCLGRLVSHGVAPALLILSQISTGAVIVLQIENRSPLVDSLVGKKLLTLIHIRSADNMGGSKSLV